MVRRRFVEYFPSLVCLVEPSLEALFLLPVIVLKSFPIIQHILSNSIIKLYWLVYLEYRFTCCRKTEDFVGAGPRLMLPLPVADLIKCVFSVSCVCLFSFK